MNIGSELEALSCQPRLSRLLILAPSTRDRFFLGVVLGLLFSLPKQLRWAMNTGASLNLRPYRVLSHVTELTANELTVSAPFDQFPYNSMDSSPQTPGQRGTRAERDNILTWGSLKIMNTAQGLHCKVPFQCLEIRHQERPCLNPKLPSS